MLLLLSAAAAAEPTAAATSERTRTVVVCPVDDTCDADLARVDASGAGGGDPVVPLELLLERDNGGWRGGVDTRAALAGHLEAATAAAAKGRWAAVDTSVDAAKAALADVRGDVNTHTLFTLWFLDGAAAVARGNDEEHAYAFRQAAAIQDLAESPLPPHDEAAARVWADERRKLVVGGSGTLTLDGPDGTRWSVDGVPLGNGVNELLLFPGTHRLVAWRAGSVRSWQGDAPVLAGRTVAVTATFGPETSATWLQARLVEAFDTLQAPPALTGVLAEYATRNGLDAVRLVDVEPPAAPAVVAAPVYGAADPNRPAAADGERADHGDGIPSTYAEELVAVDEAARARTSIPGGRVRVIWFDPALQRFSLDAGPALTRPDVDDGRFRVSLHLGYTGMMAHHHAAADLGGAWRVGPVEIEARLGLVRADAPYNLYSGWVDLQLYHVALGVRWAPDWPVAPFFAAGPELYIPAAYGGRVSAGAQARIGRGWLAVAELHGGWLDQGPGWGVGLALGHRY